LWITSGSSWYSSADTHICKRVQQRSTLELAFTYLGEGVEAGKNRTSDPRRVLALWGSVDLDFDIFEGELLDLA